MTDDSHLDALLAHAAPTPQLSVSGEAELDRLARDVERTTAPRSRAPRYIRAIAIAALVVGAATGGAAVIDRWLEQPPYQGLPEGWSRSTAWAPVDFTTVDGHESRCRTYVDFVRISEQQLAAVNAAIEAHDWDGFGQRAYDALAPQYAEQPYYEAEFAVTDAAFPVLDEIIETAVASVPPGDDGAPQTGAYASTCRQDGW
jgi:hypothetical protein